MKLEFKDEMKPSMEFSEVMRNFLDVMEPKEFIEVMREFFGKWDDDNIVINLRLSNKLLDMWEFEKGFQIEPTKSEGIIDVRLPYHSMDVTIDGRKVKVYTEYNRSIYDDTIKSLHETWGMLR